jgi:hypothetical protein
MKMRSKKNLPICVSEEDISFLISKKTDPTGLIKKYITGINIKTIKKTENTQFFKDILFKIYHICAITNSIYKEHNKENKANKTTSISEIKKP